ncbi:translation initiation factor IF-2-like [Rousettus aegyptiacus]|uniref:translation initiation factor IF-2-like n=1 Tax=Rousettus aegyptiacus TaxID=9407 RepID=UPI00168D8C28|nr:translation initiation factor IF-2-like [Rousettus aegyptiacus]
MPSCKPRTLSSGNSFVPNAAFLRAAGENSTRATGPHRGPGRSRQGSAGPASGRRVGRWLRGPAKKRPRAQPAERGVGAADGGGPGERGLRDVPSPGDGDVGRSPCAPSSCLPALTPPCSHPVSTAPEPPPVPRQPPCGSGLRRGVPASRVPSPDLQLLSEASRSAPCSAAVTAPGPPGQGGVFSWRSSNADAPSCPHPSPECVRSPRWVTGAGQACHALASKSRLTKPAFMSKAWPSGFLDAPGSSGRQRPAARSHFPRLLRVTAAGRRLTVGSVVQAARPLPRLPGDLPPSLRALLGSHHTLPGGRDQAGLWDYTWEQVCRRKVHPDDGLLGFGPVGDVA